MMYDLLWRTKQAAGAARALGPSLNVSNEYLEVHRTTRLDRSVSFFLDDLVITELNVITAEKQMRRKTCQIQISQTSRTCRRHSSFLHPIEQPKVTGNLCKATPGRNRDIFDISNKSPPSIETVHKAHTSFRSWIKQAVVTFRRLHPSRVKVKQICFGSSLSLSRHKGRRVRT